MSTHNICFLSRNKKNNMWIPSLICSYGTGPKICTPKFFDKMGYVNNADPDQTAPEYEV